MGVRRSASGGARGALSSFVQGDDWQIPPSLVEADVRDNWTFHYSLPSSPSVVDLTGSVTPESGMWAMSGIPFEEDGEFRVESVSLKRDDDPSRALILHSPDQTLDYADAPMLADGPVPRPDTL